MVATETKENEAFLEKSIRHLEARGFEDIEADLEGYESPKSFIKKSTGAAVAPDIVARKDGSKYFFELSLKSEETKLLKSKWLFLDTLSRLKEDKFRIITTRGHYRFTDNMLADINLSNKTPIKI